MWSTAGVLLTRKTGCRALAHARSGKERHTVNVKVWILVIQEVVRDRGGVNHVAILQACKPCRIILLRNGVVLRSDAWRNERRIQANALEDDHIGIARIAD